MSTPPTYAGRPATLQRDDSAPGGETAERDGQPGAAAGGSQPSAAGGGERGAAGGSQPGRAADGSAAGDDAAGDDAAAEGGAAAAPRGSRFGTHQVLWGLGGLMLGLATGILGTVAQSSHHGAPASPRPVAAGTSHSAAPATAARAVPGTTMVADGVYTVGHDFPAGDVRRGTWHSRGAIGGATGSCYVALLRKSGGWRIIDSRISTGPVTITTTRKTKAIRTSGCRAWHRIAAPGAATPAAAAATGASAGSATGTQPDESAP